ncbi:hypothetical protein [Kibdelosporangium philippinense]|nr:hypothetical protein [Kibdelosporangium philippinense]
MAFLREADTAAHDQRDVGPRLVVVSVVDQLRDVEQPLIELVRA